MFWDTQAAPLRLFLSLKFTIKMEHLAPMWSSWHWSHMGNVQDPRTELALILVLGSPVLRFFSKNNSSLTKVPSVNSLPPQMVTDWSCAGVVCSMLRGINGNIYFTVNSLKFKYVLYICITLVCIKHRVQYFPCLSPKSWIISHCKDQDEWPG